MVTLGEQIEIWKRRSDGLQKGAEEASARDAERLGEFAIGCASVALEYEKLIFQAILATQEVLSAPDDEA